MEIRVFVKDFTGVRLVLGYEIKKTDNADGVCTGTSEPCFLNAATGRPVRLQKGFPCFYNAL